MVSAGITRTPACSQYLEKAWKYFRENEERFLREEFAEDEDFLALDRIHTITALHTMTPMIA